MNTSFNVESIQTVQTGSEGMGPIFGAVLICAGIATLLYMFAKAKGWL